MTNERNNPWAGLASYEDPTKSERKLKFCGRDNDIYDVTRLIDDNLLLILYGKSGIGKTSLLNAGVFPKLRMEQYLPVSIRLGTLEADASYPKAIIDAIERALEEIHGSVTVYNVVEEQTDDQKPERLWNFFARHRFANTEGQPIFPVVVLDQFEEVLRNASHEHVKKTQTLLNQLQYLIDENHALNDCIVDGQDYFYDFNFRFVISIREDELYLLEDNIDDLSLSMFRNCRYRLRSLSEQGATEAILVPGKDCIAEEQKQAVVDRVIALSKRPQSNDIDTLLLSMVCSGTYDKKNGEKITVSDLAIWKSNPMEVYYQDAVKGLPATQVRYIQQHLIREDGSRRRVDAEKVKTALGEATYHKLTQGSNRLLTLGDKGQVELLHDQLGMAVYEERKAFEERERKKKLRRRVTAIGIIILAIAGIFFFQNHRLKQQRWRMMENQSRFIAEKAGDLIDQEEPYMALRLLLEVLPKEKHDKPITIEAERAFRKAYGFKTELFKRHDDIVLSVAISSDGRYVISASLDATVKIWDVKTGAEIRTLEGCSRWVNSATFSPDGKCIVLASYDRTVKIWDIETGDCLRTLKEHPKRVNSASYSPDGKRIVTASNDSIVRIWEVETGQLIQTLKIQSATFGQDDNFALLEPNDSWLWLDVNHSRAIENRFCSAAFSPNGKYVVSEFINIIIIWDAATGKLIRILKGHTGIINSISFGPEGKLIASASEDKTAKIWNSETGECLFTFQGVISAAFSYDGKLVVSAYEDGSTIIWDAKTGEVIQSFEETPYYNYYPAFSPDGKYIVSASYKNVSIRALATEERLSINEEQQAEFFPIAYSPDGKYIVTTVADTTLVVIDMKTGLEIKNLHGHTSIVYSTNFSPDGRYIVSASEDKTMKIWNAKSGNCIHTLNGHTDAILSAAFSPDGRRVVSASADSTIRIWSVETGKELMRLKGRSGVVYSATFSPDGSRIVSISEDRTTKVWEAKTGSEIVSFEGPEDYYGFDALYSATFTLNGECIIAPSDNNQAVNIWNIKTSKIVHTLKGNIWWVNPIVYTSEGERVVTTYGETVKVWDTKTGVEIQSFQNNSIEHSDNDYAIFSPNGKQILSVNDDGTIRIWPFPPLQDLIDQTRERFKDRPLTPEERKMYYLE